ALEQPSNIALVASQGQSVPGVPGASFDVFGSPAINDGDHVAFEASITGAGIAADSNSGIWAESGTDLLLVARAGGDAPGVPGGVFATLGDPVYNDNDQVAFQATLQTGVGQVVAANSTGIWANTSGTLSLVARAQDQAPGCKAGTKFASFSQL